MNRKEYSSVYAYSVPFCLSTSWHSRKLKPCGAATMMHSLKSPWLTSPHRRRGFAPVYYQPTCSAKGPKDEGSTREQWFSGLKLWFNSKQEEKTEGQTGEETDASANANGFRLRDRSGGANERKAEANRIGRKESNNQGIKWPWQKDKKTEDGAASVNLEARKTSKDDNSRQASRESNEEKEKLAKVSFQERFESVTRIIAPRLNPEKNSKMKESLNGREDEGGDDKADEEQVPAELEKPQDAIAQESVRELYQPPRSKESEEGDSDKPGEKRWFRLPWKRKEEENDEVDGTRNAQTHSQRKRGQEKAEVIPERIDSLEEVEAIVEVACEQPPEDVQTDKGRDEDDEKVESEREKEAVSLSKVKEAEVNSAIADMITIPQRDVAEIRLIFGSETFFATETVSMPGGLIFRGNLRGEPKATLAKLEKKLSDRLGEKYTLCLAEGEEDNRPVVVVVPTARDKRPPAARQKVVSLIVALMAISTCVGRGFFASILRANIRAVHGPHPRKYMLDRLFDLPSTTSVTIAFAVMMIVAVAQVVQRLVAMRHKTRVALPFFLPSYQLGTFGAVVQIASPTPSRSALFDIALAGMVTMVTLSSICLIVGLRLSTTFSSVIAVPMSVVSGSVIMGYLTQSASIGCDRGQLSHDCGAQPAAHSAAGWWKNHRRAVRKLKDAVPDHVPGGDVVWAVEHRSAIKGRDHGTKRASHDCGLFVYGCDDWHLVAVSGMQVLWDSMILYVL
ncbi:hypothetical protein FGB62_16g268 [Gracilaria domingensis]|nr:hypothetical protein FGB62_16g268 [Gracilaria domingensis]